MGDYLVWGLVLMGLSVLLVLLEVFIPSYGILAITAVIVVAAGITSLFFHDTTTGLIGLLTALGVGPFIGWGAFVLWKNSPLGRIMLGETNEEQVHARMEAEQAARDALQQMVGKRGHAVTDLRPVGVVVIEGHRMDASSEIGIIDSGQAIEVVRADGIQITVKAIDTRDFGERPPTA